MSNENGPVSIKCPTCDKAFSVPTEVLGVDGHQVVARMDRTDLYGHLAECSGMADAKAKHPAGKGLEKAPKRLDPIHERMLTTHSYIALGGRACTMCGAGNPECMTATRRDRRPCCPACADGNTHPSPGAQLPCAEWAVEHGAKN